MKLMLYMPMNTPLALTCAVALLLTGCRHGAQTRATAAAVADTTSAASLPPRQFTSQRFGFSIHYPTDMRQSTHFDSGVLADASWKAWSAPDAHGTPVLMLVLPGSNRVTTGQLRIGVNATAHARAQCRQPPAQARPQDTNSNTLDGVVFTTFHAADAGMSHYRKVRSWRTVHAGRCYAIDLLVTGTQPQVYDPPRTPPFTNTEAFRRLQVALQGFRFLSRNDP